MAHTVKAAAAFAGVSVRTLHHYDHVGLLRPSALSPAGYRLYGEADLARLQQILFFRELGFELKAIGPILDAPGFDRRAALARHRALLEARQDRLQALITTVDRTIHALDKEQTMAPQDLFDGFEPQPREWAQEAERRWGETDAWKQSKARTKQYTPADWAEIKAEGDAIMRGLAELMDGDPADPAAQALIGRHHRQIDEKFYACSRETYGKVAEHTSQDPRFAAAYDKVRPGLAEFVARAKAIYCQ